MKLIDKDALVAEIERRKHRNLLIEGAFEEDIDILSYLNTLEVKEVDLEKELEDFLEKNSDSNGFFNPLDVAKHFFELGVKAQKGE